MLSRRLTKSRLLDHLEGILNYCRTRIAMGVVEAINGNLKTLLRRGRGTQATSQPKVEVFPESDRDYFLKVVDVQISFVRNGKGRATELILHQGGQDRHAKPVEGEEPPP